MSVSLIKAFLKQPVTIVGIITALLFQVFFSLIWVTGYDHVTDRVTQMPIAIVNEDGTRSQPAADGIAGSLKFKTVTGLSLPQAQTELDSRTVRMIIHIPQGFAASLGTASGQAHINYYLNQSNPQMVANVMQAVANQITAALNDQTTRTALEQTLGGMSIPAAQAEIIKNSIASRIAANVHTSNPAANFAETMVPLMIVTASFTGSMLLAMNLNKASAALTGLAGKWQRLAVRFSIMGVVAVTASLISVSLIYALGIRSVSGFFSTWMFEFLIILACMALAQLSLTLLGDAGAWLNIGLLSLQMVSSGATIPREILSPFYIGIGRFFPASYAVDGMLDLVIGGTGLSADILALITIAALCILLTVLATALRRAPRPVKLPVPQPAEA